MKKLRLGIAAGRTSAEIGALLGRSGPRSRFASGLCRAYPEQSSLSAETVYQYLYALPRGPLKRELLAQLRRPRPQRRP